MRWVFAGRDDVVSSALAGLAEGRSLVISGDAGVGKTCLALDLIERLNVPAHAVVRFGAAPALEDVPFGALARYALGETESLAGSSTSTEPAHDPDVASARLRAVYRALLDVVADEPEPLAPHGRKLLLLIDDVQWLDSLSAAAVAQLVLSGDALVIATRRSGLPAPEDIRRLRTSAASDVVALEPFTIDEVAAVLAANLGPVETLTIHELHAATGGNALLLEDLVRAAQATGSLRKVGSTWLWDRDIPTEAELNELIEDRIARLSSDETDALRLVAAGEPLPLAVANLAIGRRSLAALEREGIVRLNVMGDDDARLSHPLYGEIVRSRMGPLERAECYARLVEASKSAEPSPDPTRVAVWCLDARTSVDPAHLVAASQRAISVGDSRLARRLAERALEAGDRPDSLIAIGRALALSADKDEAVAILAPLVERPGLGDEDRVEAGLWAVTALLGRVAEAEQIVEKVLQRLSDPAAGDLLRAQWAYTLCQSSRWREARPLAEELAASDREDVAMRAVQPLVISTMTAGECSTATDIAMAALPRALALAETVPEAIRWVFACCVTGGLVDGRLHDVQGLLDLAAGVDSPTGAEGYLSMIRGKLALLQGRPRTATTELEAAIERLRLADDAGGWLLWTRAMLVEATALIEPAVVALTPEQERDDDEYDNLRCYAWAAFARGDRRLCLEQLTAVADKAEGEGNVAFQVLPLHDALRLGGKPFERLEAITRQFESRFQQPVLAHIRGRRDGDLDSLDDAAQGFEATGSLLLSAECWATSARLAAERGLVARSRQASARSVLIAEHCEGAVTPGLELPGEAPDLTARERRVAREAAAGRRSKEIAEELGISVRTVDNLLGRVYVKLGVSGRDELASVIGSSPSGPA